MSAARHTRRLAIAVPAAIGVGLLAGGVLLLPGRLEILHANRRAEPEVAPALAVAASPTPVVVVPAPVALPPPPPSLAAVIPTADAAALATLTARLIAEGQAVSTRQVAYDLIAAGRPAVALAYLAARADGATPATWRLRFDLLQKTGRTADATALVAAAARAPGDAPPADLIAAAYAIDRADLIVAAAAGGAIPAPDATLALDLARRADREGRADLIAMLDRATRADWRAADPWLAIRVAERGGDTAAALRAAGGLPAAQRETAREAILTKAGDRAALRTMLLARAAAPGARVDVIAEQLLAAGQRDDAIAMLKRAAAGRGPATRETQRLLYLMGPRPAPADLTWLRQQAMRGASANQLAWLAVYAERDRAADALVFLSRHPLAMRTDVILTRLSLARAAGDEGAARTLVAKLLDGRTLDAGQLRTLSAAAPRGIAPAQASAIVARRVDAGVANARDRLDLAWAAWNGGDAAKAATWLGQYLDDAPEDPAALRLMADVQAKLRGAAAARPWLERALAQAPRDSRVRAELLDRLGRRAEAIALVEDLRTDAPGDRGLAALHARLLIAQGQPGRARAVLAQ